MNIRTVIMAAFAAAAVAAPACAEDAIHVSTIGKTPEQIHAEVTKAAEHLCALQYQKAPYDMNGEASCVADSVHAALAKTGDPTLMKLASR